MKYSVKKRFFIEKSTCMDEVKAQVWWSYRTAQSTEPLSMSANDMC
jgi:hypothetical protein